MNTVFGSLLAIAGMYVAFFAFWRMVTEQVGGPALGVGTMLVIVGLVAAAAGIKLTEWEPRRPASRYEDLRRWQEQRRARRERRRDW